MELELLIGLKKEEISKLSKNWIRTSEEFASIFINRELSKNLQQLLEVSQKRYDEIAKLIMSSLSEEQIKKIFEFNNGQNKTGAKKPLK